MKQPKLPRLLSLILLPLVLSLSSCQTSPTTIDKTEAAALTLRASTAVGAVLILKNNPRLQPVATEIVAGLDQALTGSIVITADVIDDFVAKVAEKRGIQPADAAVFRALIREVYQAYLDAYQPKIVLSSDPNAQVYIKALRDGLMSALAALPKPTL